MTTDPFIYRSPKGKANCLAIYDAMPAHWPVPYEQLDLPTRFGSTHVIVSGPQDAPPPVLLPGNWATAMMWSSVIADLSRDLPQGSSSGLDPRRESELWVARGPAPPLAEALQIVQGQIVTRQIQQAVQQHATMPIRQDKAVAISPARIGRVVPQVASPDGVGHRRGAHGQSGVSRLGLLHGIRRQEPDGIHSKSLEFWGFFRQCVQW